MAKRRTASQCQLCQHTPAAAWRLVLLMAGVESLTLCASCVKRLRVYTGDAVRIHAVVQELLRDARAPSPLLQDLGGQPNPHALTWLALNWRILVVGNRKALALDARSFDLQPDPQAIKWLDKFLEHPVY